MAQKIKGVSNFSSTKIAPDDTKGELLTIAKSPNLSRAHGLSCSNLKVFALCAMTLDHLAAYGFTLPFVADHQNILRIVGRIAFPLFLFAVIESYKHTRNRVNLLLRLLAAASFTALFSLATNFFFYFTTGFLYSGGNIFYTYFYLVLLLLLIDSIREWRASFHTKECNKNKIILYGGLLIATQVVAFALQSVFTYWRNVVAYDSIMWQLLGQLSQKALPTLLQVDYSILWLVVGVALRYLSKQKACVILVFAAILSQLNLNILYMGGFFDPIQKFVILAIPFILLYNGEKGKNYKLFYYCYYPLHIFAIEFAANFLL